MNRSILHCDMNNCFASIEAKLNPSLKNKPIAVCGSQKERHGIVLAKSQEAKILGVKTGEAIWEAKIKCPDLLIVPPHYDEYLKHSNMARELYYEYTNQVESFGLDEAWLDVTGSQGLYGSASNIADELRNRMKKEIGITISVGVSFNKVFAKLGSDLKKPDAITIIDKKDVVKKVWPLDVDALIGIGPATKRKLNRINIFSLGDLARANPKTLKNLLGINGPYLWNLANGNDNSPVADIYDQFPVKSIGHGITCTSDLLNDREVMHVLQTLALKVTKRLIEGGFQARGVYVSVRDRELKKTRFQAQFAYPTVSSIIFVEKAMELFRKNYIWEKSIRSIRIKAINLLEEKRDIQLQFFEDFEHHQKRETLDRTIYDIKKKFGEDSITFGGLMEKTKLPGKISEIITLPTMRKN
ncbi:MAG: DNA polymerase IV [Tissierellia bacterium]|nr:DNA polymerase IV [Tissierellia bacterium]